MEYLLSFPYIHYQLFCDVRIDRERQDSEYQQTLCETDRER